jgi:hypothetical protein
MRSLGPNSYLRRKVEQLALDQQHNWGRIWRITYDGTTPDRTRPRMYSETAAQLVRHLEHPNGWWRDTAQEQLVLRQDKSVVPALKTMVTRSPNQLARIQHRDAEGPSSLDAALARSLMKDRIEDPHPAIRASESLYSGDKCSPPTTRGFRLRGRHPGHADAKPAQDSAVQGAYRQHA